MNRFFSRRKRIFLLSFLGIAGLLSSLFISTSGSRAAIVQAQEPADRQPASFSASGRLVPVQWVNLSFPEAGQVTELFVAEGDTVQSGAELARLGKPQPLEAGIAAAELELLLAQQAYDNLYRNAGEALAQAGVRLAEARQAQEDASWKVRRIKTPAAAQRVEQAYANLLISERSVARARKDLDDAEKLWNDRKNIIWWFAPRGKFKLQLRLLNRNLVQAERKYQDAVEKYDDLRKPVDEIDLQVAEAELAMAEARLDQARRDQVSLSGGPDPDDVILAQARIQAAAQALAAARAAAANRLLTAPISGQVVSLPAKEREWLSAGQQVLVLADPSTWKVEIDDLPEAEVSQVVPGQLVKVTFPALPGLEYEGQVESISLVNGEEDGDITYTVTVVLPQTDPRLRWGMTAAVDFQE